MLPFDGYVDMLRARLFQQANILTPDSGLSTPLPLFLNLISFERVFRERLSSPEPHTMYPTPGPRVAATPSINRLPDRELWATNSLNESNKYGVH